MPVGMRLLGLAALAAFVTACGSSMGSGPTGPRPGTDSGVTIDTGPVVDGGQPGMDTLPPDAPSAMCRSDRDCPGAVCDRSRGVCTECLAASDCPSGDVCQTGHCVAVTHCTSSRMCTNQVCNTALGYCVDCVTDVDCNTGLVCRRSSCVMPPRPCRSSRECNDLNQVCDAAHGHCVDCEGDNDCTMGQYCGA